MSRTIRRKGDKNRNKSGRSHFITNYVTDYSMPTGVTAWRGGKKVLLTGKEYDKAYYAFHSDTKSGYGWGNHIDSRSSSIVTWRSQNKTEIIRYIKDNEYEIMLHEPRCLSWDR